MRYFTENPGISVGVFGETYACNHPVYDRCTLYRDGRLGLAVIQQYYIPDSKRTYWAEAQPWLANAIYLDPGFQGYFQKHAGHGRDGLYPTVTVRQLMWALRMKPLKKERWETVFDRRDI